MESKAIESEVIIAPYGSWKSPITSQLIVSATVGVSLLGVDGDDIYWKESRPTEGGRNVIIRRTPDGATQEINPSPFNARTRVHEYGGADSLIADGTVYFVNFADQHLYRCRPGEEPEPLTHGEQMRYADFSLDRYRQRLICVREDHSQPEQEAVNSIVAIDLSNGVETVLVSGDDFYASPRISPDGAQLAWQAWNHPSMPWDGNVLSVATVADDGSLQDVRKVAGAERESIYQPEWSPAGELYFVSDRSGWWNLFRWDGEGSHQVVAIEAEFGRPLWQFGSSTYTFVSTRQIISAYCEKGTWHLGSIDAEAGKLEEIYTPFTAIGGPKLMGDRVLFTAGSPQRSPALVALDPATGDIETLKRSSEIELDQGYLSQPETIEFPTEEGLTAFGFYYPARNKDYRAPEGELPPLLVMSHGGPTSATSATLSLGQQYWTSRGIAVLDVNYGGSTGYGRDYKDRLRDKWGIVDVDDCSNGARYLAEKGLVDGNRLAITGGSAGGFTTLAALTFRETFMAGASHFGVSDLSALASDTHKFESRYLDGLVGPYPERMDLYVERAPIHHVDQLARPVIFFQGLEDKIVPPDQAEAMVEALRKKGLPVAYLPFEGEQHGFRKAENIRRSLDGELYFYSRIFGFELADEIEPVQIENLEP